MAKVLRQNAFKNSITSFKSSISYMISENRIIFCLTVLTLLVGIAAGTVTYRMYGTDKANPIFTYIQNYFTGSVLIGVSSGEIFKAVIKDALKLTAIIFVSGLSVFLSPLAYLRVFFKGFSLSMTVTFFIMRYAVKGVIFSMLSVFICDIIIVPALVITVTAQTAAAYKTFRQRKLKKQSITSVIIRSAALSGALLAACLISAPVQCFVSPGMMKGIYTLLSSGF